MIAIVLACEVKGEPPVEVYLDEIRKANEPYKIICWAPRSFSPIHQNPPGCIEFKFKKRNGKTLNKIVNYFRFRRFLIKKLKEICPDKIIFIPTQAGVLLPKRFFRKWDGRYYFDYRDPGYENYHFYLKKVMFMVNHSFATAISSKGFLDILEPSDKYVLAHNGYNYKVKLSTKKELSSPISIVSIGTLRTPEFVLNQIKPFAGDNRFLLRLYGTGNEMTVSALNVYLKENEITNVIYEGRFQDEDLARIIDEADALLVYYLSKLDGLHHMPDRLYLGLEYGKPMIGNSDTYCGRFIVDNGLGYPLSPLNADVNGLANYLKNMNLDEIQENAASCLAIIEKDNELWRESIRKFIKS